MKTCVWLIVVAIACFKLDVSVDAKAEYDDTLFATSETIVCDGQIKVCESGSPVCTSRNKQFASKCEFENYYCENPSDDNFIVPCDVFQSQSVEEGDEENGRDTTGDGVPTAAFDVPIDLDQSESPTLAFGDADVAVEIDEPVTSDTETTEPPEDQGLDPNTEPVPVETDPPTEIVETREPTPEEIQEPFTEPVPETLVESDPPTEPVEPSEPPAASSEPESEWSDPPTDSPSAEPSTDVGKTEGRRPIKCDGTIQPCPIAGEPVCTSYGTVFSSYCEFENAYCDNPREDFFFLYYGHCQEKDIPLSAQDANSMEDEVWAQVFDVKIELDDAHAVPATNIDCSSGTLACSSTYDPVCTSKGRTYMNECHFKNAYCDKPKKGFYIVSKGKCSSHYHVQDTDDEDEGTENDTVTADVIDVPIEIDEVAVDASGNIACASQKKESAYCSLVCQTGTVEVDPVCGSDGQSYINACHLLSAKCENPKLEKAYSGLCIISPVGAGGSFSTLTTNTGNAAKPKCNPRCAKTYSPVCGSNSITYANECLLDYAVCVNPAVKKLGDGKCPDVPNHSSGTHPRDDSSCVPPVCSSVEAPVCGTDGETYTNACFLQVAQCTNRGLTVHHEGPCDADTILTCATLSCPLYTECREEIGTQVAYCADVCHSERCAKNEICQLLDSDCFTAPCSPVATCVSIGTTSDSDF